MMMRWTELSMTGARVTLGWVGVSCRTTNSRLYTRCEELHDGSHVCMVIDSNDIQISADWTRVGGSSVPRAEEGDALGSASSTEWVRDILCLSRISVLDNDDALWDGLFLWVIR